MGDCAGEPDLPGVREVHPGTSLPRVVSVASVLEVVRYVWASVVCVASVRKSGEGVARACRGLLYAGMSVE